MTIIGLGYRARSGKDTVASFLVESGFHRLAFADTLKAAARSVFGFTQEQTDGELKETLDAFWGLTPRNVLQRMGTEAMRSVFGPDVWVQSLRRRLDWVGSGDFVITDVRFRNEAEAIKAWGGIVVRVDRPGIGSVGQHISEHELDGWSGWDHVIDNSGTLEELRSKVDLLSMEIGQHE